MSILIVGDHPGLNETNPFTNGFWRYFKSQMSRVGINPNHCYWVNCISRQGGTFYAFTQEDRKGALPGLPQIARKAWLRAEFAKDIQNVYDTIRRVKPNIIIAVGEMATIVLTHETKLSFARGRITTGLPETGGVKVLPVYHPRSVLASINEEPILFLDLLKAKRQSTFPQVIRPLRWLHLEPSITDLEAFWQDYIEPSNDLSIDIETKSPIITCVGIAPSPERCLVIPFFTNQHRDGNYWRTPHEELIAWKFVDRCLNTPGKTVFGQNFQYDVQYLWRFMGIKASTWTNDTMLMHHALQIEMPKGLGFLASIYSEELAWKFMAKRPVKDRSGKKEDV